MGAKGRRQTHTGPEWGREVGLHIFCSLVADELKKRLHTWWRRGGGMGKDGGAVSLIK